MEAFGGFFNTGEKKKENQQGQMKARNTRFSCNSLPKKLKLVYKVCRELAQ